MTVLGLLQKAKEILSSPSAWIKGSLHSNGGYCLTGALQFANSGHVFNEAYDGQEVVNQAQLRCQMAIWEQMNEREWNLEVDPFTQHSLPGIPDWNDREDAQHEEIIVCLERAIKIEETINLQLD